MVKENPNKESCKERMKELIRKKRNRNQVVKRCMREFDGVHKSTFMVGMMKLLMNLISFIGR